MIIIVAIIITITVIVAFVVALLFLLLLLRMPSAGASVVDWMLLKTLGFHCGVAETLALLEFTQRYQPTIHNIAEERRPRAPTGFIVVTFKHITSKTVNGTAENFKAYVRGIYYENANGLLPLSSFVL